MLSIIIPVCSEEKHLPNLLNSIKNQTYTAYEIIISDCSSKDHTIEIAKNYGCKIIRSCFYNKKFTNPQKQAIELNKGVELANGDYFLFIDADMILNDKNMLDKVMTYYVSRYNIEVGTFKIEQSKGNWATHVREIYRFFIPFATQVILVRKDIFYSVGGFKPVGYCLDVEFTKRIKQKGYKIHQIPLWVTHTRKYYMLSPSTGIKALGSIVPKYKRRRLFSRAKPVYQNINVIKAL
ncbi:glycosyltransferase [Patescibacteria group bacterium]|nr:glycosyltransferase [Patescibacteria group bacterium]